MCVDYFLVGSLASMYYGKPRFTQDIDLVVNIRPVNLTNFADEFDTDAFYFPPQEILKDEVSRRGIFNLLHQASGIKIDIVLLKDTEFYVEENQRKKKVRLSPDFEAFIASPEDIIVKKLDFYREGGSEKHLIDIGEIILSVTLDYSYLEKWTTRLGLQKEWEKAKKGSQDSKP